MKQQESEKWIEENFENDVRLALRIRKTIVSKQSKFQKIDIVDTERFGKVLLLDGAYMTSEFDEFVYHEMLSHPALTTADRLDRVLVIGGGDGGTVREVMKHAVGEVVMVEIDGEVVELCKKHLPSIAASFDDPRLDVQISDGIEYVQNAEDHSFDVVLLDGTDPVGPGAVLFSESFLTEVKRILKPTGVFALQSESPLFFSKVFRETQITLQGLFRSVHPMFAGVPLYPSGSWSWTWCSDERDHFLPDSERLAAIREKTKYYNQDIHAAAFARPSYVQRLVAESP